MARRERQLLVLVGVVDGGLQVCGDRVISRDFGGNVDGLHAEHGVAAGNRVGSSEYYISAIFRFSVTSDRG